MSNLLAPALAAFAVTFGVSFAITGGLAGVEWLSDVSCRIKQAVTRWRHRHDAPPRRMMWRSHLHRLPQGVYVDYWECLDEEVARAHPCRECGGET